MKKELTETEVLQKALEMLKRRTGLIAEAGVQPRPPKGTLHEPDAKIRLALRGMEWNLAAEVKRNLTRATLGANVYQMRKFREKVVLVTRYITPQIAEQLKEMDIPFLDMAGNAYLNEPPLFIFIKGEKAEEDYRKDHPTRAFQQTGLQVIFALLCNPRLENAPYREIAKQADVALGTVNWVMVDLRERGFLVDMGKRGRRLVKKENLLARWAAAYPDKLRLKKRVGTYTAADIDWWKNTDLADFGAYWGGEVAAAILTEHLKPQEVTIYTREKPGKLILTLKLRKELDGNIEILKTFWNFNDDWGHDDLVHPILIYADLLATGDARNIETAEIVYEQAIARFIRED